MKYRRINLTVDNCFRHPLHWNRCNVRDIQNLKMFGVSITVGEKMPTSLIDRWSVVFYFYKWYYGFSNYKYEI